MTTDLGCVARRQPRDKLRVFAEGGFLILRSRKEQK
jgi:hypothetical protein